MYDLRHFKKEHEPYFDQTTFHHIEDAADAVLARHQSTSLAELFSVELKFFVDTLNACFNSLIKPKFLELDILKTQYYRKDNLIDRKKTICSICGFLLDVDQGGWIDFIAKSKYLFLRNMYLFDRLKSEH